MTRIEKRLWWIWLSVMVVAFTTSAGLSLTRDESFPFAGLANLRRALRPDREPRKIEKATSLAGVQTIRVRTSATRIRVSRNDAITDLGMILEGRFLKSTESPLDFEKSDSVLKITVDEGLKRLAWANSVDDSNRNSALTLDLPRNYSGNLVIETVSGAVELRGLSLGSLEWSSLSGEFLSRGNDIHVARLKSVSGGIDFEGETLEFSATLTSADVRVVLRGLEHAIAAKVDAQTVSGRMDVSVSPQSSLRISISSFTGEATSTIDLKRSMQSAGAFEGTLGAGGGELRMRSVSGSVHLSTFN